jgi:hypothetical protein
MLVGASKEEGIHAQLALPSRKSVAGDRRIRVPNMGPGIHVVDRRGDVEL